MKYFLMLTLCCAAALAAPANLDLTTPTGNIFDFRSSILGAEFEENFKRIREEFDQLGKSLETRFNFPNIDETGVKIFENGQSIFNIVDPSKVKNESFSDTKVVDGKVVHTEEKVIANENSVVHIKTVQITPNKDGGVHSSSDGGAQPKGTFTTPASSVPAVTPSKNDVDSEHADIDESSNRARDVEEIDPIEPLELRVAPEEARKWESNVVDEAAENDLYGSDSNVRRSSVVDLSEDTKVNDILSQKIASGGLIQPESDAEIIEIGTNKINRFANNEPRKPANENDNNRFYYHYEVEP